MERIRSEDGTPNRTGIVGHAQNSTSGQGGAGTPVGDRMTNNGWMGRFTFVPGPNVTKTHTGAGNRYIPSRRPLKRTTGLGSSSTTARGPRSMTRSS